MFQNINSEELQSLLNQHPETILLDVRTDYEFEEGHIPNAKLQDIYEPQFADALDEMNKKANYIVYCKSGGRSMNAIMMMMQSGFTGKLYNLEGGITAYTGEIVTP